MKDPNGDAYTYTLQARDQTEFTADFEATWSCHTTLAV